MTRTGRRSEGAGGDSRRVRLPCRGGRGDGRVAGKSAGEQSLARRMYARLEEDWLLIADRNFYNWAGWCAAADSGAAAVAGQG